MKKKKANTPKQNRIYRVTVRLTADELSLFKQKAEKMYGGKISRLIVNAVELLNEDRLTVKYNKVDELSRIYDEFSYELGKSGTNLNQAAKQLNAVMLEYGNHPSVGIIKRISEQTLKPAVEMQHDLVTRLNEIFKKLLEDIMKHR